MKKLITTLFAMAGIYTVSFAQQSKGVEIGIGVGYNGASVSTTDNQTTKSKSGVNVALSLDAYFSSSWSLKIKPAYDQKGWADGFLTVQDGGFSTTYKPVDYKLNYITVPVMANWHFGSAKNWYLNLGPYVGFLTSANVTNYPTSVKEIFNDVDGGVAYGIGVKIPLAEKAKFFIEFDGQNGVADLFATGASTNTIRSVRGAVNIGFNF